MKRLTTLIATALIMSGCSVNDGLNLTGKYLKSATAWQAVKQEYLINKLPTTEQQLARNYTGEIDQVLTFIHTWANSDKNAQKKLALKLPLQIIKSRTSFSRLTSLVIRNKTRYTTNELNEMARIRGDLQSLSDRWDSISGANDKISQLLSVIETVQALRSLR